jgi:hypothetical protein
VLISVPREILSALSNPAVGAAPAGKSDVADIRKKGGALRRGL